MPSIWKKGHNPDIIITLLNRFVNVTGSDVSFTGFHLIRELPILTRMVDASDLTHEDLASIVRSSLIEAAKKGKGTITQACLGREISRRTRQFMKLRPKDFILVTSISAKRGSFRISRSLSNSRIAFDVSTSRFAINDQSLLTRMKSALSGASRPDNYTNVVVSTTARSVHEAFEIAENRLCELRGIWNLLLNHNRRTIHFSVPLTPINRLLPGPFHTLHQPDGTVLPEVFWYEPNYRRPVKPVDFDGLDRGAILNREKKLRKLISGHPHQEFILRCLRRYATALDSCDFQRVFLDLWGLMETLTLTKHQSYDVTINRALFPFKAKDYVKANLRHLRECRNDLIHAAVPQYDTRDLAERTRDYVEVLLLCWINTFTEYTTSEEIALLLDAPRKKSTLQKRIHIYQDAMKHA